MEVTANLPAHVAVIMDGNGRWAKKRGLPRLLGHRAGMAALRRTLQAAGEMGIKYLSVYAFSTENWNRPAAEVSGLMDLLGQYARQELPHLIENGVKVRFCGSRRGVPPSVLEVIDCCESETSACGRMTFIPCFNYGGRQEIIDAVTAAQKAGVAIENENDFRRFLYLPDVPDPDLIIRTSGELRLSNFWLWESSYSEYYFSDVLWPDFGEKELRLAIESYAGRERRYGTVR
ncbi:MAG: polyprenyl diphosphate synthase [Pyramidobacter sp.]|jgi:undecaprenyl diphosphate synthase